MMRNAVAEPFDYRGAIKMRQFRAIKTRKRLYRLSFGTVVDGCLGLQMSRCGERPEG
jgi:hypothetical protein